MEHETESSVPSARDSQRRRTTGAAAGRVPLRDDQYDGEEPAAPYTRTNSSGTARSRAETAKVSGAKERARLPDEWQDGMVGPERSESASSGGGSERMEPAAPPVVAKRISSNGTMGGEAMDMPSILQKGRSQQWQLRMECAQEMRHLLQLGRGQVVVRQLDKVIGWSLEHLADANQKVCGEVQQFLNDLLLAESAAIEPCLPQAPDPAARRRAACCPA